MTLTRRQWTAAGAAALAAGGAGLFWRRQQADAPARQALADLLDRRFDTPDGAPLVLSTLRGQPLLINFWATWCPPCVREMPELDQFAQEAGGAGWRVLGVALDQPEAVRRFLASTPVRFPVVVAGLDLLPLVQALGNAGGGLPFSLHVGGDGQIRHRKLGATTLDELRAWAQSA